MIDSSDWRLRAACRGMAPVDGTKEVDGEKVKHPFFPEGHGLPSEEVRAACARCPVRAECEAEGVDQHGIWGGKAANARKRNAAAERRKATARRRREVHRLRGLSTAPQMAAQFGVLVRYVYRDLTVDCGEPGCWCAERAEATG